MSQQIWILYHNDPGLPGRVIGTFTTPEKAMSCKAIRGQVGFAQWHEKDGYWICQPHDKEYYLSAEPSTIDLLASDE